MSAEAVRSEKRGRFKELGLKMRRIQKTEEQKFPSQTVSRPPHPQIFLLHKLNTCADLCSRPRFPDGDTAVLKHITHA